MKQVLQCLRSGKVTVEDVPVPLCPPDGALIRTTRSLVSPGTERMLLEFGRASLLEKMRSQPERVRQVWEKIQNDGLLPTLDAVKSKLDEPLPLGYCNVGVVEECNGATFFRPGTRVVSNGWHADYVTPGASMIASIPDGVTDDNAAFTVLGAVALQGIRLAQPTLGETFFVAGLGTVGLLAVQLLRANGCRVIASDFSADRLALARSFGAEAVALPGDTVAAAMNVTGERGVDGVILAAATESSGLVRQAARMCRQRGRVILVGVAGLDLDRSEFFKKEITFQVSCSYGPGRYDPQYEAGADYPLGFVRWTAQRNFEAVLQLLADRKLDVAPMVTHRVAIGNAAAAYETLLNDKSALGILLEYRPGKLQRRPVVHRATHAKEKPSIAIVGAGAFTRRIILPALAKLPCELRSISSARGASAAMAAKAFKAAVSCSDAHAQMADPEVDAVIITTRHNTHAVLVCEAIRAGKHVFVEKPLAITLEQLAAVTHAIQDAPDRQIRVGFNRRHAALIADMKTLFSEGRAPLSLNYTVNAGVVPRDSWIQDPRVGGGRIIGEVCHFIDVIQYVSGASWISISADGSAEDQLCITLMLNDGSQGSIQYWSNGPRAFPKEQLLVFGGGRAAQLDNFRSLSVWSGKARRTRKLLRQDKGHRAEFTAFVDALKKHGSPGASTEESISVTLATFAAREALQTGRRQTREDWEERLEAAVRSVSPEPKPVRA